MADSYSQNPMTTAKDAVRFEIFDTTSPFVFNDSEITYTIEQNLGNIYLAAADLLDRRARELGGVRSKSIGDLSETYDAAFYQTAADRLRAKGETIAATVAASQGTPYHDEMGQVFSKGQFDQSSKGPRPRDYDRIPPYYDEELD